MRFLIALVLALFATIAFGYEPGKEYSHKLEGYVYSFLGKETTKKQYAGTAIIADVAIQVPSENTFLIKIKDVKFDVVNALIESSFEKYPFEFKDVPAFSELITKPFKVVTEHGKIKQYYIADDEPEWSLNLKKSFLNILQICLKHDEHGEHSHIPGDDNYYTVSERGTIGECDTTYSIRSEPTVSNSGKILNVTKVRNYEKCAKRPHPFAYAAWSLPCDECDHSAKRYRWGGASSYNYDLQGDRDSFVIEKVVQKEYIYSAPFGKDGLSLDLWSRRTLELYNVKDITDTLVIADNVTPETDLIIQPQKEEFFDSIDLQKAHYFREIYRYQAPVNQLLTQFDNVIAEYGNSDANPAESFLPSKFGEIIDALSTLDHADIVQVFKAVWEKGDNYRKLFLDSLASTGTNPAFVFGKSLIQEKKLENIYPAHKFLLKLAMSIKSPSAALFNQFQELCLSDAVKECPKLRKACYLTFSGSVGRECVEKYYLYHAHQHNHHHNHKVTPKIADHTKHHCNPETALKYMKALPFENTDHDINLRIKTLGNFKLKEGIPFINSILKSGHKHYLRTNAVWSFMGRSAFYKNEIKAIVAPTFLNKSEEQDIRIAAFYVWIFSDISLQEFWIILNRLMKEDNKQIVFVAYQAITALAESKYPCYGKLQINAKFLQWLFKMSYDRHGGRRQYGDALRLDSNRYNSEYKFGASRIFAIIPNNRSYVPLSIYMGADEFMGAKHHSLFGIIMKMHGIEKVINRLFGRKGIYWRKSSIFDIFKKRLTRDTSSVESEVKKIEKSLPLEVRDYEELHFEMSLNTRGIEYYYVEFDDKLFAPFLKDGTITIPNIQKLFDENLGGKELNGFYQKTNDLFINRNEIGVPYFYNYRELSRINIINNKFKFNIIPALFSEDRDNKAPLEIQLSADIKVQHHEDQYFYSGLILPVIHSKVGSGIHRKTIMTLPLNLDLSYKYQDKKISIKRVPQTYDLLYDKNTPFTFLDTYSNSIPMVNEPQFKPLYKDHELKKYDRSYLQNYFGYGLKISAKVPEIDKEKIYKFYTDYSFLERLDIYKYHPKGKPSEMRLTLALPDSNPTTEFKSSLSWKDTEEEENEVSDFSYNEDSHFKDYTARKDRSPETHVLKWEITGEGNIQRNIYAELRYSHSRDLLLHKINLNYDRSPINDNGYKVCAVTSMKFPDHDIQKFIKLDTMELDQTVNFTGKIAFGENCDNNAKINIKAQLSQSEEQKILERSREVIDPDKPNPYAKEYNKCKNSKYFKDGRFPYCYKYLFPISEMRQLTASIEYENIPERIANHSLRKLLERSAKRVQYIDLKIKPEPGPDGRILYESTSSATKPKVSYRIETPYFTAIYKDVPYPLYLPPVNTFPLYGLRYKNELLKKINHPFCMSFANMVRTFDNVTYVLPKIEDNCETILAKDCSPENNFMVLAAKVNDKYRLKLFLQNKIKIQLTPKGQGMDVEVNGKSVTVTKTQPYIHTIKYGIKDIELFSISFDNALYYVDAMGKFGVSMSTEGFNFGTQSSLYYRGKVCGICGDNSGEGTNEFRGSDGKLYKSPNPFVYSYVVPDDNCSPPSANELTRF